MFIEFIRKHIKHHSLVLNPDWDIHEYVDCSEHTAAVCCVWSAPMVGADRVFAQSLDAIKASGHWERLVRKYGREPSVLVWDWGWQRQ